MCAETTYHEYLLRGVSDSQSIRSFVWTFLRKNDHNELTDGRIATIAGYILFNCL